MARAPNSRSEACASIYRADDCAFAAPGSVGPNWPGTLTNTCGVWAPRFGNTTPLQQMFIELQFRIPIGLVKGPLVLTAPTGYDANRPGQGSGVNGGCGGCVSMPLVIPNFTPLGGPGFQWGRSGVLLCAGPGDSHTSLDCLRCRIIRYREHP